MRRYYLNPGFPMTLRGKAVVTVPWTISAAQSQGPIWPSVAAGYLQLKGHPCGPSTVIRSTGQRRQDRRIKDHLDDVVVGGEKHSVDDVEPGWALQRRFQGETHCITRDRDINTQLDDGRRRGAPWSPVGNGRDARARLPPRVILGGAMRIESFVDPEAAAETLYVLKAELVSRYLGTQARKTLV